MATKVYISSAVTQFKKSYYGPIQQVTKINELKELIAYYSGIKVLEYPLVIDGLSQITGDVSSVLLKFIEDTPLEVILLYNYDVIDEVLLSRVKEVVKYNNEKTTSDFLKIRQGVTVIEEKLSPDTHYYDKVRYYGKYAPKIYMMEKIVTKKRLRDKLFTIMD